MAYLSISNRFSLTYLSYIKTILPKKIGTRELIVLNAILISISLISLTQDNFQWEGVVSVSIVLGTSLLSMVEIKFIQSKSLLAYSGLVIGLLFALYSKWAPASIVISYGVLGLLCLLFLDRPWGGLLLVGGGGLLSIPIAMTMTGFSANIPIRFHDEVLIIAITVLCILIDGFYVARRHRKLSEKVKRATSLVDQMQDIYLRFEEAIINASNVEEMFWQVTDLCIPLLRLEDCVIYTLDTDKQELRQVAAYGPKSKSRREILSPLRIKVGEGIVGKCAELMTEIKVDDLSGNVSYIKDDASRFSELAVPIIFEGKVYGVIDSEHSQKRFFSEESVILFRFIATLCAGKIGEFQLIHSKLEKADTQRALYQANQMEAMRNSFLNNLSHDLRTPLSLIKGPLQGLRDHADPAVKNVADVGLRNAERLNEMVSGLLEMHKLERGGLQINMGTWDLSVQIHDWYALFLHEAEMRNIDYTSTKIESQEIQCDAIKIGQIVQNLLSNAFKFTPDGGQISLIPALRKKQLEIEVHDSGPGIPEDKKAKVFERFFKVDSDSHIQGTGLGLAIVKELTELMDGKVEIIKSKFDGAAFRVRIPFELKLKETPHISKPNRVSGSEKPLVVFIEDHPEMREFVSGVLTEHYEVLATSNAETGWDLVLENIPDLIITDLMLPGMNGDELCKKIKTNIATDHLPVIALTAKQSTKARVELYSFGADNYISKPFETEELLSISASLIDQRAKLRERFSAGASTNKVGEGIRQIDQIIHREMDNSDFGPRDLEKEIGLNRNQLQKKIKAVTGYTPVEYFRVFRLEEARRLIREGQCNVSEAAFQTGFNQLAYFSKSYKKHFGVSPSEDLPIAS